MWNIDFILAKEGETESIAQSSYSFFASRSVSVEMDLQPGNYLVLVRNFFLFFLLQLDIRIHQARVDPAPVRDKASILTVNSFTEPISRCF